MTIGMIASIAIGVTTQELVSSLASMVILTMFVLLIIFVTIVLFAYSVELKRREEDAQLEKKENINAVREIHMAEGKHMPFQERWES